MFYFKEDEKEEPGGGGEGGRGERYTHTVSHKYRLKWQLSDFHQKEKWNGELCIMDDGEKSPSAHHNRFADGRRFALWTWWNVYQQVCSKKITNCLLVYLTQKKKKRHIHFIRFLFYSGRLVMRNTEIFRNTPLNVSDSVNYSSLVIVMCFLALASYCRLAAFCVCSCTFCLPPQKKKHISKWDWGLVKPDFINQLHSVRVNE